MKKLFPILATAALLATAACEHDIDIRTDGEQQQLSLHVYFTE